MSLPASLEDELVFTKPESWQMGRSLIAALEVAPEPLGKWDLIEAAGIPEKAWSHLISGLVADGRVVKTGNTRAATYRLAES